MIRSLKTGRIFYSIKSSQSIFGINNVSLLLKTRKKKTLNTDFKQ